MSSGPGGGATSPVSSRMTKAAFFRARSPPIDRNGTTSPIPTPGMSTGDAYGNLSDLAGKFDAATRLEQQASSGINSSSSYGAGPSSYTYNRDPNDNAYSRQNQASNLQAPSQAQAGQQQQHAHQNGYYDSTPATDGHAATLDRQNHPSRRGPSPVRRRSTRPSQRTNTNSTTPTSPRNLLAGIHGVMSAPDSAASHSYSHDESERYENGQTDGELKESAIMGFAEGSDEMLLALLAGQAAVDCERLPISGWEEVESWKKELSILSTRLESLRSRHQREIKILTAAKTLQKLNNSNKRMSRQTMESLEQAEKRVEAAEKEVYVLQDREAGLRRRLMEHWSGVMAWEVRRLERSSAETQARYDKQSMKINNLKDREVELIRQNTEKVNRVQELEEMVIEMGRRERAIEEEARDLDHHRARLEQEREGFLIEREDFQRERDSWTAEKRSWDKERSSWDTERRQWIEERASLIGDRQRLVESSQVSAKDQAVMDQIRLSLGGLLGRKMGSVGEHEVLPALEEVKGLISRREREVVSLRDEMREVNMGLEEELRRVGEDRDAWKTRVDQDEAARREEGIALTKKIRNQQEQINDLSLRNESLSSSLQAAQNAVSSISSDTSQVRTLQAKVDGLSSELESIASQFNSIWSTLPPPSKRVQAELIDPRTGNSNSSLASPSKALNFAALQELYQPHHEQVGDISETLTRIRGVIEDSKILVQRTVKMGQERELLKGNAAKAKKLVEESTKSLVTYQQQVAVLEDQLAKSGSTESHFLDELNNLQSTLDNVSASKRNLETQLKDTNGKLARLEEANDVLSTKALDMAQIAEDERSALSNKLNSELEDVKKKLQMTEQDADEERAKSQGQRIQLLDELNSLQAEVGDLRKQLRAKS
ncbi:uncharacterized protein I303_102877 [Kwoniella dejecticola CBS 10117]|uniref:Up-regulated during septation protein 1 domain-containing protein n=1 Tax=Kwoniella dejecticola CBS 10117 TaxID=1296121 RepID=A0A1A6A9Y5_9TREE|nr:uncharacterized protein I303_02896 [Kwoniella dejecticola CBS 10117]OBR86875.1 hypothetical protein I303_02896 [Kwoniella dejecticola CBS 10117]